jgi:hypothetical protein
LVGCDEGALDGDDVGVSVGFNDGESVGGLLQLSGFLVCGALVGSEVGALDGLRVTGLLVGFTVGV